MKVKLRIPRLPIGDIRQVFHHFGHHLRSHVGTMIAAGACLAGTALMELARPWPLKIVFDYILLPSRRSAASLLAPLADWPPMVVLAVASGAILGVAILGGLFKYGQNVLMKTVGHSVTGAIRLQLFSHIQRLPQSYHDYRKTGDLMVRMTGDLNLVKDLMVSVVMTLGSRIVVVVGMLAAMIWMDATLTLIALGVIPVLLLVNTHFTVKIKDASRHQRKKEGMIATSVHESITGIGVIKAFSQERRREKQFEKNVSSDVRAGLRMTRLEASFSRTVELVTALGMCAVLWFGVQRVMADTITAGDLLIFFSYMRGVYRPLRDLARLSTRMAKAIVAGQRIIEVLELDLPALDDPNAVPADNIKGDLQFENLGFEYKEGHPVLHGISCHIPAGKVTAIIGASGAGKSTIGKLLLRLYEPTTGRIILDGRDIREYRVRGLRKQITSLAQDVTMFNMSIKDNIAFANPKAGDEAVYEAARKAGADAFIETLPEGYDTILGEGGLTVSGGQRQRLAFARAALRDSRIMLFDEPATGLDAASEREAKDALAALQPGRTTIIITHRLNFLDLADHVILLERGRVVAEGDPGDLADRPGPYADFVQSWYDEIGAGEAHPTERPEKLNG